MAQARYIEESAALAQADRSGAARAGADEPARDSAGAVPRARRRQHAGRARRDGLHHQRRAGKAARIRRVPDRASCRHSSTASRDSATRAADARRPTRHRRGRMRRAADVASARLAIAIVALVASPASGGCSSALPRRRGCGPPKRRRRRPPRRPPAPSARSPRRCITSRKTACRSSACSARCRSARRSLEQARRIVEAQLARRAAAARLGDPGRRRRCARCT